MRLRLGSRPLKTEQGPEKSEDLLKAVYLSLSFFLPALSQLGQQGICEGQTVEYA